MSGGVILNTDNAAGVSISERMRAKSEGTTMAKRNADDALSLMHTADAWLQKINDMLGRMKALGIEAGSIVSETDKDNLQTEFEAMQEEIQRITSKSTAAGKFNGIDLFKTPDFVPSSALEATVTLPQLGSTTAEFNISDAASLEAAIVHLNDPANSNENVVLNLQGDINLSSPLSAITSSDNSQHTLTINGNGHTLSRTDGGGDFGLLDFDSTAQTNLNFNIQINTVNFEGGRAPVAGGAINIDGDNSSTIDVAVNNSTFTNNSAVEYGGAIHQTEPATMSVSNSIFSNNTVLTGSLSGTILSEAPLTVINTVLSDNTTSGRGGGILARDQAMIINSTIYGNSSGNTGGGIGGVGTWYLLNTAVVNNAGAQDVYGNGDLSILGSWIGSSGGSVTWNAINRDNYVHSSDPNWGSVLDWSNQFNSDATPKESAPTSLFNSPARVSEDGKTIYFQSSDGIYRALDIANGFTISDGATYNSAKQMTNPDGSPRASDTEEEYIGAWANIQADDPTIAVELKVGDGIDQEIELKLPDLNILSTHSIGEFTTYSYGDPGEATVEDSTTHSVSWSEIIDTRKLDVTSDNLLAKMDLAIDHISVSRASVAAQENRLQNIKEGLLSYSDNLNNAESKIRDVDMARESSNLAKQQVLANATNAMLAQANQLPSSVLDLLGG